LAYVIKLTDDGLADVKSLPKNVRNALKKVMKNKVVSDPYGCLHELKEPLAGWGTFHFGEYRVIYKVFDDLRAVGIAGVGRHDVEAILDIYRRLEAVAKTGKLAERILITMKGVSRPTQRQ
jgi:mRNA-degrading endonuclease RelE of RelBE toxin-antitoxin system